MRKLFSFLLIVLVLGSAFSGQPVMHMKMNSAKSCMMMHMKMHKSGSCNNNKQNTSGAFCSFCVLCIAYIVPVKPGIERNFVSIPVTYPDLVQSKLTDYNPSCWRPPNA